MLQSLLFVRSGRVMARPRDNRKPRWTSRRFSIGFVENFQNRGIAYARIGSWRKTLKPLRFVAANRSAGVRALENLIEARAYEYPPSRVSIAADGSVEILPEPGLAPVEQVGSFFEHARNYRLRRIAEGVRPGWDAGLRLSIATLIGEEDLPLDAAAIRQVIAARLPRELDRLSPYSVKTRLATISGCCSDAVRSRLLEYNPCDGFRVTVPDTPKSIFTAEEEARLFAAIKDPARRQYYQLLRVGGLRRTEAYVLTTDSIVNVDGRRVLTIEGKGGRRRMLPIDRDPDRAYTPEFVKWSDRLISLVDDVTERTASGRLFPWPNVNEPSFYFRRVRMRIGLPSGDRRSLHALRRAALTEWRRVLRMHPTVITLWAGNSEFIRGKFYYAPDDPESALASLDANALDVPNS